MSGRRRRYSSPEKDRYRRDEGKGGLRLTEGQWKVVEGFLAVLGAVGLYCALEYFYPGIGARAVGLVTGTIETVGQVVEMLKNPPEIGVEELWKIGEGARETAENTNPTVISWIQEMLDRVFGFREALRPLSELGK